MSAPEQCTEPLLETLATGVPPWTEGVSSIQRGKEATVSIEVGDFCRTILCQGASGESGGVAHRTWLEDQWCCCESTQQEWPDHNPKTSTSATLSPGTEVQGSIRATRRVYQTAKLTVEPEDQAINPAGHPDEEKIQETSSYECTRHDEGLSARKGGLWNWLLAVDHFACGQWGSVRNCMNYCHWTYNHSIVCNLWCNHIILICVWFLCTWWPCGLKLSNENLIFETCWVRLFFWLASTHQ